MKKPFAGTWSLTQGFGENQSMYARFGINGHNGHDYGLPTGTEVLAPHNGKIIEATNDPAGYGNYIKIENDIEGSVLAHLQKFLVKVGDIVQEGQIIALSNNTGNSTGPHLHFGYYRFPRNRQDGYGGFIDPSLYIEPPKQTVTLDGEKFTELVTKATKYDDLVSSGYANALDIETKIRNLQSTIDSLNQIIKDKDARLATAQNDISELNKQLLSKDSTIEVLQTQANRLPNLTAERDQLSHNLEVCQSAQETQNRKIAQLENHTNDYSKVTTDILVKELVNRIINKFAVK